MVLGSVGWAAIPVIRPLTKELAFAGDVVASEAGPMGVQLDELSGTLGCDGACAPLGAPPALPSIGVHGWLGRRFWGCCGGSCPNAVDAVVQKTARAMLNISMRHPRSGLGVRIGASAQPLMYGSF